MCTPPSARSASCSRTGWWRWSALPCSRRSPTQPPGRESPCSQQAQPACQSLWHSPLSAAAWQSFASLTHACCEDEHRSDSLGIRQEFHWCCFAVQAMLRPLGNVAALRPEVQITSQCHLLSHSQTVSTGALQPDVHPGANQRCALTASFQQGSSRLCRAQADCGAAQPGPDRQVRLPRMAASSDVACARNSGPAPPFSQAPCGHALPAESSSRACSSALPSPACRGPGCSMSRNALRLHLGSGICASSKPGCQVCRCWP